MRLRITPGGTLHGRATVPGDKSIAHRWLILAATGEGTSRLANLPPSLDVRSTASCLGAVAPAGRASLEAWARNGGANPEGHRSTWNRAEPTTVEEALEVEGEGRAALRPPSADLDCGNSGTSMRLLAGVLAGAPYTARLVGDQSLSSRPMERVAEPLRLMGAEVSTTDGRAPMLVRGGVLRGVRYAIPIPTAQVKSAIVFAALTAEGETVVEEPAPTRDHTERALTALGAPVVSQPGRVRVRAFQHPAFDAAVPGDVSSAAFLIVAAALTGSEVTITGVGLNPSRTAFLRVLARMGVETEPTLTGTQLGEPVGELRVLPATRLSGTTVSSDELPLVVDEVPVLSALAAHAHGETWFLGAAELRVKESDRLAGVAAGVRALGGHAGDEAGDLMVAGTGLRGGVAQAGGDHRMAMALAVAALAADAPCDVEGIEAADVSFPGFPQTLAELGARVALQ